jgi:hydrogenase maturation protease
MSAQTLVLSLGNILRGDDGIGAAVLEQLETRAVPEHVTLVDGGTPGFETVLLWQGYERVIIIDAADMDGAPGVWHRFTPDDVRLQSRDLYLRGTLHYVGLAEALNLGAALHMLPPEIIIYGIQPRSIDWDIGLSPELIAVIPTVCDNIMEVLNHGENINY